MQSRLIYSISLILVVLFLSACGGGGGDSATETTTNNPIENTNPAEPIDDTTPTGTAISPEYYGSWKYAHDGSEIYITSATQLDFSEVDENQLKVNDNGDTKYLIRNGVKNINLSGSVYEANTINAASSYNRSISRASSFNGIGGVNVILENVRDKNIKSSLSTDSEGKFSDNQLPSGQYNITVNKDGKEIKTEVTLSDKDTTIGNFFLIDENTNNFKTELIMSDGFMYANGQTYNAIVRIHNISNVDGIGLAYELTLEDSKLKSFTYDNVLGTIQAGSSKDIPIHMSFENFLLNEKNIELNVKIKDINYNEWNDAQSFKVYRTTIRVNLSAAQSNIRGYVTLPNGNQKNINMANGYVDLPSIVSDDYFIILSNPDLSQETSYSIGYETPTASLSNFNDTGAYEATNTNQEGATEIEKNSNISAYLHVGDIDFYKINMTELSIYFPNIENATLNTIYLSKDITITDNILKNGTIATIDSGSLVLNGINVGQTSSLTKGDVLQISLESTSMFSSSSNATLTIGDTNSEFTINTLTEDNTPDDFNFINVYGAIDSTTYISNSISIVGINTTINISTTHGSIIKNGIDLGKSTSTVVNGDKIKIKIDSILNATVRIGSIEKIWEVSEFLTFNTLKYGVIKSPYTNKIWLDRNLGATEKCNNYSDLQCEGDYYQWGRRADGHEKLQSEYVYDFPQSLDNTHENFVAIDYNNYKVVNSDWAYYADSSGVLRQNEWAKTDGTSICPVGFRVPTADEFKMEFLDINMTTEQIFTNHFLNFAANGGRSYYPHQGYTDYGLIYLWTNTKTSTYPSTLKMNEFVEFNYNDIIQSNTAASTGLAVRCIKDDTKP